MRVYLSGGPWRECTVDLRRLVAIINSPICVEEYIGFDVEKWFPSKQRNYYQYAGTLEKTNTPLFVYIRTEETP